MSKIELYLGNITKLDCEAIVNAANNSLLGGGGVDGAIHRAAGPELLIECRTLNGCKTGEAKITKGYNLKAKYVIHTVGPIYSGNKQDKVLLANCYKNSLNLAKENGIKSIAFPAISTGVYAYPINKATAIAVKTVKEWLIENNDYDIKIIFCCFDEATFIPYKKEIENNKVNDFIIFTERTIQDVYKIRCVGPTRTIRENLEVYHGKKLLSENAICVYPLFDEDKERFFKVMQRYAEVYKLKNYIRVKLFQNDTNENYLHIDLIDVENKTANPLPPIRFCDNVKDIKDGFINVITENSRYVGHILFLGLGAFRFNHPEIEEILKKD